MVNSDSLDSTDGTQNGKPRCTQAGDAEIASQSSDADDVACKGSRQKSADTDLPSDSSAIEPTPTKTEINSSMSTETSQKNDLSVACYDLPLERQKNTSSNLSESLEDKAKVTRKLLCLYCDRSFVSANLRQKHVERVHSVKSIRRVSARRQNQLSTTPCIYCDKLSETEHTLNDLFQHLVQEHPLKYFGCLSCDERFLTLVHLGDHNRSKHLINESGSETNSYPTSQLPDVVETSSREEDKLTQKVTRSKLRNKVDEVANIEDNISLTKRKKKAKLKELRNKKISVKTSKIAIKRSKRLQQQAKDHNTQKKRREKKPLPNLTKQETFGNSKQLDKTKVACVNPYPEFDHFYRVKKITDHSIDNLKISSLTFDDVFDKAFFNRIKCNIEDNLLHHIDGKLFKNEESESRISNFEKVSPGTQEVQNPNADNYGCELSLNAITPASSLSLNSQFGEDFESQIEYGSKPSKKKPQIKSDEVHYKYFTRRKYQASILQQKENRDLSKLDMWTQMVVKDRQEKVLNKKKSAKEIQEYSCGQEYRSKIKRQELNRILDRRGPFEDLKEEASKKAAFDKLNSFSDSNITEEVFTDVREVLNDLLNRVFEAVKEDDSPLEISSREIDHREIPAYLDLRRKTSSTNEEIDKSDKIALICSSQETENFELPTNTVRAKNELVELTGEWARSRMYICAACGGKFSNMKYLLEHKSLYHQNVWVQHYEFVGNQSELYRHLSIPGLGKVGVVEDTIPCKLWKRSDARTCTKCGKQCNSLGELHRHVLECGGDWTWMLARKKCRYKPFGAKARRKRRGFEPKLQNRRKTEPIEKKIYKKPMDGPRQRPSDADTIQRMLANLPAKRSRRSLISLTDVVFKSRKSKNRNTTQQLPANKVKCGKSLCKKKSNSGNAKTNEKRPNRTLRSLNRVLSSRILDLNSSLLVKRKMRVLRSQRLTRNTIRSKSKYVELTSDDQCMEETVAEKISTTLPIHKKHKPFKESLLISEETAISAEKGESKSVSKRMLTSRLNLKNFFPVKKKNNIRLAHKHSELEKTSGESENDSEIVVHTNEKVKYLENFEPTKKSKRGGLKGLVRALSLRKRNSKSDDSASTDAKAEQRPTELELPKKSCRLRNKLVATTQENSSENVASDFLSNKRKLQRSFRNVIKKVKKFKTEKASKVEVITDNNVNPIEENAFLEKTLSKQDFVSPEQHVTSEEVKENMQENVDLAHTVLHPANTSDSAPNSSQIGNELETTKSDANLESNCVIKLKQLIDATISSNHLSFEQVMDRKSLISADVESKIGPVSIDTSLKSKSMPMISPNVKGKLRKPSRGLNDCIAMLTSKLQHKDEKMSSSLESLFSTSSTTSIDPRLDSRPFSDSISPPIRHPKPESIPKLLSHISQFPSSEETALDLSNKSLSTPNLLNNFHDISPNTNATKNDDILCGKLDAKWTSVDDIIQEVVNHSSSYIFDKPKRKSYMVRTNVDDTIDFVVNNSSDWFDSEHKREDHVRNKRSSKRKKHSDDNLITNIIFGKDKLIIAPSVNSKCDLDPLIAKIKENEYKSSQLTLNLTKSMSEQVPLSSTVGSVTEKVSLKVNNCSSALLLSDNINNKKNENLEYDEKETLPESNKSPVTLVEVNEELNMHHNRAVESVNQVITQKEVVNIEQECLKEEIAQPPQSSSVESLQDRNVKRKEEKQTGGKSSINVTKKSKRYRRVCKSISKKKPREPIIETNIDECMHFKEVPNNTEEIITLSLPDTDIKTAVGSNILLNTVNEPNILENKIIEQRNKAHSDSEDDIPLARIVNIDISAVKKCVIESKSLVSIMTETKTPESLECRKNENISNITPKKGPALVEINISPTDSKDMVETLTTDSLKENVETTHKKICVISESDAKITSTMKPLRKKKRKRVSPTSMKKIQSENICSVTTDISVRSKESSPRSPFLVESDSLNLSVLTPLESNSCPVIKNDISPEEQPIVPTQETSNKVKVNSDRDNLSNSQRTRRKSKSSKKIAKIDNGLFKDFSLVINKKTKRIPPMSIVDDSVSDDLNFLEKNPVPESSKENVTKQLEIETSALLNDSVEEMDMEIEDIPISSTIIERDTTLTPVKEVVISTKPESNDDKLTPSTRKSPRKKVLLEEENSSSKMDVLKSSVIKKRRKIKKNIVILADIKLCQSVLGSKNVQNIHDNVKDILDEPLDTIKSGINKIASMNPGDDKLNYSINTNSGEADKGLEKNKEFKIIDQQFFFDSGLMVNKVHGELESEDMSSQKEKLARTNIHEEPHSLFNEKTDILINNKSPGESNFNLDHGKSVYVQVLPKRKAAILARSKFQSKMSDSDDTNVDASSTQDILSGSFSCSNSTSLSTPAKQFDRKDSIADFEKPLEESTPKRRGSHKSNQGDIKNGEQIMYVPDTVPACRISECAISMIGSTEFMNNRLECGTNDNSLPTKENTISASEPKYKIPENRADFLGDIPSQLSEYALNAQYGGYISSDIYEASGKDQKSQKQCFNPPSTEKLLLEKTDQGETIFTYNKDYSAGNEHSGSLGIPSLTQFSVISNKGNILNESKLGIPKINDSIDSNMHRELVSGELNKEAPLLDVNDEHMSTVFTSSKKIDEHVIEKLSESSGNRKQKSYQKSENRIITNTIDNNKKISSASMPSNDNLNHTFGLQAYENMNCTGLTETADHLDTTKIVLEDSGFVDKCIEHTFEKKKYLEETSLSPRNSFSYSTPEDQKVLNSVLNDMQPLNDSSRNVVEADKNILQVNEKVSEQKMKRIKKKSKIKFKKLDSNLETLSGNAINLEQTSKVCSKRKNNKSANEKYIQYQPPDLLSQNKFIINNLKSNSLDIKNQYLEVIDSTVKNVEKFTNQLANLQAEYLPPKETSKDFSKFATSNAEKFTASKAHCYESKMKSRRARKIIDYNEDNLGKKVMKPNNDPNQKRQNIIPITKENKILNETENMDANFEHSSVADKNTELVSNENPLIDFNTKLSPKIGEVTLPEQIKIIDSKESEVEPMPYRINDFTEIPKLVVDIHHIDQITDNKLNDFSLNFNSNKSLTVLHSVSNKINENDDPIKAGEEPSPNVENVISIENNQNAFQESEKNLIEISSSPMEEETTEKYAITNNDLDDNKHSSLNENKSNLCADESSKLNDMSIPNATRSNNFSSKFIAGKQRKSFNVDIYTTKLSDEGSFNRRSRKCINYNEDVLLDKMHSLVDSTIDKRNKKKLKILVEQQKGELLKKTKPEVLDSNSRDSTKISINGDISRSKTPECKQDNIENSSAPKLQSFISNSVNDISTCEKNINKEAKCKGKSRKTENNAIAEKDMNSAMATGCSEIKEINPQPRNFDMTFDKNRSVKNVELETSRDIFEFEDTSSEESGLQKSMKPFGNIKNDKLEQNPEGVSENKELCSSSAQEGTKSSAMEFLHNECSELLNIEKFSKPTKKLKPKNNMDIDVANILDFNLDFQNRRSPRIRKTVTEKTDVYVEINISDELYVKKNENKETVKPVIESQDTTMTCVSEINPTEEKVIHSEVSPIISDYNESFSSLVKVDGIKSGLTGIDDKCNQITDILDTASSQLPNTNDFSQIVNENPVHANQVEDVLTTSMITRDIISETKSSPSVLQNEEGNTKGDHLIEIHADEQVKLNHTREKSVNEDPKREHQLAKINIKNLLLSSRAPSYPNYTVPGNGLTNSMNSQNKDTLAIDNIVLDTTKSTLNLNKGRVKKQKGHKLKQSVPKQSFQVLENVMEDNAFLNQKNLPNKNLSFNVLKNVLSNITTNSNNSSFKSSDDLFSEIPPLTDIITSSEMDIAPVLDEIDKSLESEDIYDFNDDSFKTQKHKPTKFKNRIKIKPGTRLESKKYISKEKNADPESYRRTLVRSAKKKALENIHDEVLTDSKEFEDELQLKPRKPSKSKSSYEEVDVRHKEKITGLDYEKNDIEKESLLAFEAEVVNILNTPVVQYESDLLNDLGNIDNSVNNISTSQDRSNTNAEISNLDNYSIPIQGPHKNIETQSECDQIDIDVSELRRSSRGTRKVASYNENDLIDPIIDALENSRKRSARKEKQSDKVQMKSDAPKEPKMSSEELFDLLKKSSFVNETAVNPKPLKSFFDNLNEQTSHCDYHDVTDDDSNVNQTKSIETDKIQDVDKIYEFTEDSPDNTEEIKGLFGKNKKVKQIIPSEIDRTTPIPVGEICTSVESTDKNSDTPKPSLEEKSNYCVICKKSFIRVENLVKHKTTLTHISKLSELEAKEAEEKARLEKKRQEVEIGIVGETIDIRDDSDCDREQHTEDSSTLHNNHSLKLVDIISDVLNKPVLDNYERDKQNFPSSDLSAIKKSDTKRYKSLGERKSFESENHNSPIQAPLSASYIPPPLSQTTILEKQINLLENIIGNNLDNISATENNFIDDISSCSNRSNISDIDNSVFNTNHDNVDANAETAFVKPSQYEEISEDSASAKVYDDSKQRKTLNRDEELFLECCSLLKSGSEVSNSNYSKNNKKTVDNLKELDEPGLIDNKNLMQTAQNAHEYSDNSRTPTPLGDTYDDEASNSNTISSNWHLNSEKPLDQNRSFSFEEVKSKEAAGMSFGEILTTGLRNQFEYFTKNSETNNTALQAELRKRSLSTDEKKDDSDSSTASRKIATKGARKVYEGLKVSIPTEDLNLEVLNTSPSTKKSENENPLFENKSEKAAVKPRSTRKSKPVKKCQVGSNLLFKVNKKKLSPQIVRSATPPEKQDLYTFEETQDSNDLFAKPNLIEDKHAFKEPNTSILLGSDNDSLGYADSIGADAKSVSSVSSIVSSVIKPEIAPENITKKKYKIMGKIFRNAAKSRMDETDEELRSIAEIPEIDNLELVENYVRSCQNINTTFLPSAQPPPLEEAQKKTKMSEEEINLLFDQLLNDKPNELDGKKASDTKALPESHISDKKNGKMKNRKRSRDELNETNGRTDIAETNYLEVGGNEPNNENDLCQSAEITKKAKISENEVITLFDEIEDKTEPESRCEKSSKTLNTKPRTDKNPEVKKKNSKVKNKKRPRANSDSSGDEFNIGRIAKKRSNKNNQEDSGINLELELKECIGVASRKSQRTCTSGKQNILLEYWSSDEEAFEALLENHKISTKKENERKKNEKPEPQHTEEPKKPSDFEKPVDKPTKQKAPRKKPATTKKSNRSGSTEGSTSLTTIAISNRRKRAAANPLYHWSSSSEDESQSLIEVKPLREEDDEDDRPIQHGWIVGDSPKKLVTMLALTKGKKTDVDSVKEQGKRRTSNSGS